MNLTPYHAKYIAHELTRRCASDSVERLTSVLSDAQVDLNPHQVEAALFAFRNPLARGAILADEVGLGAQMGTVPLVADEWEDIDELADEWDPDEEGNGQPDRPHYTPEQVAEMRQETVRLREFHALARSIVKNSKGEVLLTALRRGFDAAAQAKHGQAGSALQQKALIFTESRRTQEYLFRIVEQTEFQGKVMVFNGTNTDPKSKAIYQAWLKRHAGADRVSGSPAADMRAALVDYFRDEAAVMIATEAAAEGINLQFCNLVVNYDLPWNPQRIEQRIGRCHRYGQKFDVVVVNFLNKGNAADQRVYELLDEKFRLFSGVFDGDRYSFHLTSNPFPGETIYPGPYRLGKNVEDANTYRVGHPLAQRLLAHAMAFDPPPAEVVFDYAGSGKNIAVLTPLVGRSGWLTCSRLAVESLDSEDALILVGLTDDGQPAEETAYRRLLRPVGHGEPQRPRDAEYCGGSSIDACRRHFIPPSGVFGGTCCPEQPMV
ncbi:MAG: helicase-related protein [Patescibacteria group bacterium]|nr:helicase-related protein [Patescibacteria group bacterium]